jgi:hypothetical protein
MAIDASRVIATFAIVWVHVAESQGLPYGATALGRLGTSFYVIVAAFFAVRAVVRAPKKRLSGELYKRTQRLLQPFVVWSLIYALIYGVRAHREGTSIADLTQWWGPLAGTAVHLWLLPFVFFWSMLTIGAAPFLFKVSRRSLWIYGFLASVLIYWFCYRWLFFAVDRPILWRLYLHRLDRWIVEIPPFVTAVLLSIAYFRLDDQEKHRLARRRKVIAGAALLVLVAGEIIYSTQVDLIRAETLTEGRFMANICGAALLAFFLAWKEGGLTRILAPLGRYTYIAFLAHIAILEAIVAPVKHLPGYETVWLALPTTVFVFLGSIAASFIIQKFHFLRWLRA